MPEPIRANKSLPIASAPNGAAKHGLAKRVNCVE